jgi:predicted nucleic acid-binding protein
VNFLVDTNVFSELQRGKRAARNVLDWLDAVSWNDLFTSVVVLGEIRRGIELIARRDKPQATALEGWYSALRQRIGHNVFDVDERVMMIWSRLTVPDMLPAYDGVIAATALAHDLPIVTRNVSDYQRVGLRVVNPWKDVP